MKILKFDQFQRESKVEPLSIEVGPGQIIEIPVPNGKQFMDAEESRSTRGALKVVCGDKWDEVAPLIATIKDPEALKEFVKDVMTHFRMTGDEAPNADGPR